MLAHVNLEPIRRAHRYPGAFAALAALADADRPKPVQTRFPRRAQARLLRFRLNTDPAVICPHCLFDTESDPHAPTCPAR